ncbi:MAG: FliH/SctL family protein [Eubacteriales bacterium]|nr:FliH/SctL family protein [Eubacteriales bacterium]
MIKSVYFNVDAGQTKVIDSDSRVEQFIPEIYAQEQKAEEPFVFQPLSMSVGEGQEEAFQDGLSVIHMDDVLEEERQKISQEISQGLLQETERQTAQILEDAKAEAEQTIAQARDEAEAIRSQAEMQGLEEGKQQGLAEAEVKLQEMRAQCQAEYEEKVRELAEQERQMEPFFADLTAELVEKITGIVCQDKKDIILHLIQRAVHNLEKPKQITLRVSKEDMATVSMQKAQLKDAAEGVEEFDVVEDASLKADQCIIETENKIIDCSLDVQLQNLRDQIRMLAL